MSQSSGAYGEADATEQKNEQHNNQPATSASTDATLNARAKSPKSKGPNKWIIAIIAVIAVVAIIVGVVVFRNNNHWTETCPRKPRHSPPVRIGDRTGADRQCVRRAAVARFRQRSAAGTGEKLGYFQRRHNEYVPSQREHELLQRRHVGRRRCGLVH